MTDKVTWRGWKPSRKHEVAVQRAVREIAEAFPEERVSAGVFVNGGSENLAAHASLNVYFDGRSSAGMFLRVEGQPLGRGADFPPGEDDTSGMDVTLPMEIRSPGPCVAGLVERLPAFSKYLKRKVGGR